MTHMGVPHKRKKKSVFIFEDMAVFTGYIHPQALLLLCLLQAFDVFFMNNPCLSLP